MIRLNHREACWIKKAPGLIRRCHSPRSQNVYCLSLAYTLRDGGDAACDADDYPLSLHLLALGAEDALTGVHAGEV